MMKLDEVRSVIEEANRLDEIVDILEKIIADNRSSYPVKAFVDQHGITRWRVDGEDVRKEAAVLLGIIKGEGNIETDEKFLNLLEYVTTHSDMLLHNYAIGITHRREPDVDMEECRRYLIIENMIECWHINLIGNPITYTIPDGWKKVKM